MALFQRRIQRYGIGDKVTANDDVEFIYCRAAVAIASQDCVSIDAKGDARPTPQSGWRYRGVFAVSPGEYIWVEKT